VFEAVVRACEKVDQCLGEVLASAEASGYAAIVIADHGNADFMLNADGTPNTAHSTALVPCVFVDPQFKLTSAIYMKDGKLGDLAPTILTYLGLPIPAEMTGNLLY
jgi:2,3-bisphosphoglycerate-independent phosphoglycerate mutase